MTWAVRNVVCEMEKRKEWNLDDRGTDQEETMVREE